MYFITLRTGCTQSTNSKYNLDPPNTIDSVSVLSKGPTEKVKTELIDNSI